MSKFSIGAPIAESEVPEVKRGSGKQSPWRPYFDGQWYPVELKGEDPKRVSSAIRSAAANADKSVSIRKSEDGKKIFFCAVAK